MKDYRSFVGKEKEYDRRGAVQFAVLTMLGLREYHHLLDIGCGSLRGGRLFIPYLLPGHYCGVEPAKEMVEEGLLAELGESTLRVKRPTFAYNATFDLQGFNRHFDFVLIQAVFCHLPLAEIKKCLGAASAVLGPWGKLVASFHESDVDDRRKTISYPKVAWYRMETIKETAQAVGLGCRRINRTLLGGTALHEQYVRMSWVVMEKGSAESAELGLGGPRGGAEG